MAKTGRRAEQLMSGVTKMVISLSFQFSMVRVAIIAGWRKPPGDQRHHAFSRSCQICA